MVGALATDPVLLEAGLVERAKGSASRAAGEGGRGTVAGAPQGWNVWVLPKGEGAHPVDVLVATPAGVEYFRRQGGIVAWLKARKAAARLPQEAPLKPRGETPEARAADRAKTNEIHAAIRGLTKPGSRAKR